MATSGKKQDDEQQDDSEAHRSCDHLADPLVKKNNKKQESPPARPQEAYRPLRTYPVRQGVWTDTQTRVKTFPSPILWMGAVKILTSSPLVVQP